MLLPNKANSIPLYYDSYVREYQKNVSIEPSQDNSTIPFRQIDFRPLKIKLSYCKRVIGVNFCFPTTIEYSYGKVISRSDVPNYLDPYFQNIKDLTSFVSDFPNEYLEHNYVQTAVIVDDIMRELTFFREGIEPFKYGKNEGDVEFTRPIAVKYIGNFLYVLDKGDNKSSPTIKVLKINHSVDGNFSVNYVGNITNSIFDSFEMIDVKDIGGFEGGSLETNVLLLADQNGINYFKLNKHTGLPADYSVKTFNHLKDPYDSNNDIILRNIARLDANSKSGSIIVLNGNNEIISLSISELFNGNNEKYFLFYSRLHPQFFPSNLAYMVSEGKWYVTDLSGKLHALSKDGRYLGGGGINGTSEDNGELYLPTGITPNEIDDEKNEFKYRFLIANKWDYQTGIKLFAPGISIENIKTFEKLSTSELYFTFTTSGRWQPVENAIGMSFSSVKINGSLIDPNLWNSQIKAGTASSPGDDLTSFPNVFIIHPDKLHNLKRGWNKVELSIVIFKNNGEPNEVISRQENFYWLPSSFSPKAINSQSDVILNNSSLIENKKIDFVYKPIRIEDKGIIIVNEGELQMTSLGNLLLKQGSSFYNKSEISFSNVIFENDAKIVFENGSFICVNNSSQEKKGVLRSPDYNKNILLGSGYKLGINPSIAQLLSSEIVSSCQSPCVFIPNNKPVVSFSVSIEKNEKPFDVFVDPSGTSFYNKIKWDVEKVGGSIEEKASVIITGPSSRVNLKEVLNASSNSYYNFQPCSEYIISLSIGCNNNEGNIGTDWIKTETRKVLTSPEVSAGKDESVCEGVSLITFQEFFPVSSDNGRGEWSGMGISKDGELIIDNLPMNTLLPYIYTYTDQWECSVSKSKSVIIYPIPEKPQIVSNSPVCEGEALILTSSNEVNSKLNWMGPNNLFLSLESSSLILEKVEKSYSGTFEISKTVNGCTSPSSSVEVVIHLLPSVNAGIDEKTCHDSKKILLSGTPLGGEWIGNGVIKETATKGNAKGSKNNQETFAYYFNPSLNLIGNNEISYSYTDANGCTNKDGKLVTVGPIIDLGETEVTCQNSAPFNLTVISPQGGKWSGINGLSKEGLLDPSLPGVGEFTATYEVNENGCKNSVSKKVIINSVPQAPIASPNTPLCQGKSLILIASTIEGATYSWVGPNGFTSEQKNIVAGYATKEMNGVYTVTAKVNGCISNATPRSSVQVIINEPSKISIIGGDLQVCPNQGSFLLEATPGNGIWTGQGIRYDDGEVSETPPTPFPWESPPLGPGDEPGYYFYPEEGIVGDNKLTYTVTNQFNCISSEVKTIKVLGAPTVNVVSSKPSTLCKESFTSTTLIADPKGADAFTFQWSKDGVAIPGATKQTFEATKAGNYCVKATSKCGVANGCFNLSIEENPTFVLGTDLGNTPIMCASGSKGNISVKLNNPTVNNIYEYTWTVNSNTEAFEKAFTTTTSEVEWLPIIEPGNYTVAVANKTAGGCSGTGIINIKSHPVTIANAGQDQEICQNIASVSLNGLPQGGSWVGLGVSSNGDFSPSNASVGPNVLTYTFKDGNGCNASDEIVVTVKEVTGTYWKQISARNATTVGIKSDGSLWAWGGGYFGTLGTGKTQNELVPEKIGGTNDWKYINAGLNPYTLAIKTNGTLWAWGNNQEGQLGIGTKVQANSPVQVGTSSDWKIAIGGFEHTLAIKDNGTLWAWGRNFRGPLGNGTTQNSLVPIQIGTENTWTKIAVGGIHSLTIKSDGSLWTWGGNFNGQLGIGNTSDKYFPTQVGVVTDWKDISASANYSLAIRKDGTLWAWGSGQLGNGTTSSNVPVQIGTDKDWVSIAAANDHAVALKADGSLWAWGNNYDGKLGDGTNTHKYYPVKVVTGVVEASAGNVHSVALKNCGKDLFAAGSNNVGQLGNGTTEGKNIFTLIEPAPYLVVTNPAPVCLPITVDITKTFIDLNETNGVVSYWKDLGATLLLENPTTLSKSGTYYIKMTLGSQFDIAPVKVEVNETPIIKIDPERIVCVGDAPFRINASPFGGTWTGNVTEGIFNPNVTGIFGITYSIDNNCGAASAQTKIIVNEEDPINLDWAKRIEPIEGSHPAHTYSMALDVESNIYISGTFQFAPIPCITRDPRFPCPDRTGPKTILVRKYGTSGTLKWQYSSQEGSGVATKTLIDGEGNVWSLVNKNSMLRLNSETGELLSRTDLDFEAEDFAFGPNNTLFIFGIVNGKLKTFHLSKEADILWDEVHHKIEGNCVAIKVNSIKNGDFILYGKSDNKPIVVKVDIIAQSILWKTILSFEDKNIPGIALDQEDNVFLSGTSNDNIYLSKLNSESGIQDNLLEKIYNKGIDKGGFVGVDFEGNVIVAGNSIVNGENLISIVKYSQLGVMKWEKSYSDPVKVYNLQNIEIDDFGDVYLNGSLNLLNGFLLKLRGENGSKVWEENYQNEAAIGEYFGKMKLDKFTNIFLTGYFQRDNYGKNYGDIDSKVMKYSQCGSGVYNNSRKGFQEVNIEPNKAKIFPNPYIDYTNIQFNLEESQNVEIQLQDMLGKTLHTITNQTFQKGNYSIKFSAKEINYTSGVYIIKVKMNNKEESYKVIEL